MRVFLSAQSPPSARWKRGTVLCSWEPNHHFSMSLVSWWRGSTTSLKWKPETPGGRLSLKSTAHNSRAAWLCTTQGCRRNHLPQRHRLWPNGPTGRVTARMHAVASPVVPPGTSGHLLRGGIPGPFMTPSHCYSGLCGKVCATNLSIFSYSQSALRKLGQPRSLQLDSMCSREGAAGVWLAGWCFSVTSDSPEPLLGIA